MEVRPKSIGTTFPKDTRTAQRIVNSLSVVHNSALENQGKRTKSPRNWKWDRNKVFLQPIYGTIPVLIILTITLLNLTEESVAFLQQQYPQIGKRLIQEISCNCPRSIP